MATLVDRQIRTNRTIYVTAEHARAIGDPVRSRIMPMLYGKTLSADEIAAAVNKTGPKKALTTVRHHIDVLRTTGLIEVTRIVESRGGITKYYGTSTRLLNFETPKDFVSAYSSVIDRTAKRLEDILGGILSDIAASESKPAADYSAYLVLEVMNRAITKVLEKGKRRGDRRAPKSRAKAVKRGKTRAEPLPSDNGRGAEKKKDAGNG